MVGGFMASKPSKMQELLHKALNSRGSMELSNIGGLWGFERI